MGSLALHHRVEYLCTCLFYVMFSRGGGLTPERWNEDTCLQIVANVKKSVHIPFKGGFLRFKVIHRRTGAAPDLQ